MRAAERHRSPPVADGPLADSELDALFAPLADAPLIALAVSGGADSLALLDAVDRWRGGRRVLVLTVDHRLRPGSRAEALAVARVAKARGMTARLLTWSGPRPSGDVEAAARAARYRLLFGACREEGASHLVVAHHRDDLAETFLMRLKRGSGVFGLAAMRPVVMAGGIAILRPLLGVARARLAATVAAAGLTPAVDPMNSDPRFDRARMRRLLPLLAAEGIHPAGLAATAERLADAADAIDAAATALLSRVEADGFAVAWVAPEMLAAAPREVRLRTLVRLLLAVGGDDYPPRHERLAALADAIAAHCGGRFKRTLAGAVIEWRGGRFAFYREVGRHGLPTAALARGRTVVWDHRFAITAGKGAGLSVAALGEERRRVLRIGATTHPAGALAALPAIRQGPRIVAFPPLSGDAAGSIEVRSLLAERLARPPLFPDLAAGS